MQRVFDFTPADHELVVSRILVQLHQAIDEAFPHARPASQRFAKTAFVGSDEPTLTQLVPSETLREAAQNGLEAQEVSEANGRITKNKSRDLGDFPPSSGEDPLARPSTWWRFADNMPYKQTVIGILTLILVALLAYLVLSQ